MTFHWTSSKAAQESVEMTPAESPVSQALILICEKCGIKISPDPEKNLARALAADLKQKIKDAGGKGKVRAVVTGCLDVCPEKQLTFAISRSGASDDEFYTLAGNFEMAADFILGHVSKSKS